MKSAVPGYRPADTLGELVLENITAPNAQTGCLPVARIDKTSAFELQLEDAPIVDGKSAAVL